MPTHIVTYTNGDLTASQSKTAGTEINIDETFVIGTDALMAMVIDVSQMVSFHVVASTAMTIETNNGTTPGTTISLVAGVPLVWQKDTYHANPFGSTDVTAFYVTNAASSRLQGKILVDPTV